MQAAPDHWRGHYRGSEAETAMLRHYSLSDRIRYYWSAPQAEEAVERLKQALSGRPIPLPLLWQHMPGATHFADTPIDPEDILIWRITRSLEAYQAATGSGTRPDIA